MVHEASPSTQRTLSLKIICVKRMSSTMRSNSCRQCHHIRHDVDIMQGLHRELCPSAGSWTSGSLLQRSNSAAETRS